MAEDEDPDAAHEGSTEPTADEKPGGGDEESVPLSELREDVAELGEDGVEPGSDGERIEADDEGSSREEKVQAGEPDPDPEPSAGERDEPAKIPLSELTDDLAEREPTETDESLFHREGVDEVEAEAVWAELLMGEGDTTEAFEPTGVETIGEREFQIVPTTLCHRCEFFGDPPELHCTHEGTTIHETVDMDHYRVSHCPMVTEGAGPDGVE